MVIYVYEKALAASFLLYSWPGFDQLFVAVRSNLTAVECVDFVTDCEIDLVKISLKGRQELFVGSFYMPKRNMTDLNNLRQSLDF